jgi:DNA-binding Lrp family transcriptional regulator
VTDYDLTDRRILTELDAHPRRPVALLAERLAMARGTVQSRLARLREDGRLRLHSTRIRPESLGYGTRAFVMASVEQNSFEHSMSALVDLPEVIECVAVSGAEDIVCQVIARDNAHLFEVTQHMMRIPGILRTSTSIVLQEYIELRMAQLLSREEGRRGESARP